MPEMELPFRLRYVSCDMLPSCEGIVPDSPWFFRFTSVPLKVPSHRDVPYTPVGQPEEQYTLLSQTVPAASQRPASRRSASGTRRGAEEEQTAANSVRTSQFANVMAGGRARRARVASQPPESACFAPTWEDAGAVEAEDSPEDCMLALFAEGSHSRVRASQD